MIEALLTVLPSICWILYRCFKLLRRPVEQLVEDLHMEIPHAPTICIDSVTETSVVIHWDIETRNNEYLYYVVLINNKEAATVGTTSCTLENLLEKKLYQLQILVVNANNNYRSQSHPDARKVPSVSLRWSGQTHTVGSGWNRQWPVFGHHSRPSEKYRIRSTSRPIFSQIPVGGGQAFCRG